METAKSIVFQTSTDIKMEAPQAVVSETLPGVRRECILMLENPR